MKSIRIKKRLLWCALGLLIAFGIMVAIGLAIAPKWKENSILGFATIRTPADWETAIDGYGFTFEAKEPVDEEDIVEYIDNYSVELTDIGPLSSDENYTFDYIAVWIAKLGSDGKVRELIKNENCTAQAEIVMFVGGFYSCNIGNYDEDEFAPMPSIGVAIDVTDYPYANDAYYDTFEGRKFDQNTIVCEQADSKRYKLEQTCENIVKSYTKLNKDS